MTPALIALAIRAMAAGAPVPTEECWDGWWEHRRYDRYFVGGKWQSVPVLSDPSWLGWVLAEVERRGWPYIHLSFREGGYWHWSAEGNRNFEHAQWGKAREREATLVAMLEATR